MEVDVDARTSEHFKISGWIYGFGVLMVVALPAFFVGLFAYFRSTLYMGEKMVPPTEQKTVVEGKRYISCDDVRDVVTVSGINYFACMGGVIGMDGAGNVVKQFDMPAGMPSFTVNNLVVWKNYLLAGTQNGVGMINLSSGTVEQISVEQGLNEGSNAKVALDGDTLWVGTFDGIGKVDLNTKQVTNYLAPQFGMGTQLNAGDLVVGDKYVYFGNIASAVTSGGVIRYVKATGQFEVFRSADFGKPDRVDIYGLTKASNFIVMTDMRDVFVFDDSKTAGPMMLDRSVIGNFIKIDGGSIVRSLGESDGKVILFASDSEKRAFLSFDPATNTATKLMDLTGIYNDLPFAVSDGKMWFGDRLGFVSTIDIKTGLKADLALKGRPTRFETLGAQVNGLTYILTSGSIWHFDPGSGLRRDADLFEGESTDFASDDSFLFLPINGTDKMVIYRQLCGQGCSKPEMWVAQYPSFEKSVVEMQEVISEEVEVSYGYESLVFVGQIENGVVFEKGFGDSAEQWMIDTNTWTWTKSPLKTPMIERLQARCAKNFRFLDGKFVKESCAESEASKYTINVNGIAANLTYNDGAGNMSYSLPSMWPAYKPKSFEEFGWEMGRMVFDGKAVYIPTSRGVAVFDTVTKTFKTYGPKEGLIGNQADQMMADDKYLYVAARWGGFSVIPR